MPTDDRGDHCRAFEPPWCLCLGLVRRRSRDPLETAGGMTPEVYQRGMVRGLGTPRAALVIAAVLLPMIGAIIVLFGLIDAGKLAMSWVFLPPLAAAVLSALSVRLLARWNWGAWRQSIIQSGHCPSCGYSLAEVREEVDGCRICAECGAAWRLPPRDPTQVPC